MGAPAHQHVTSAAAEAHHHPAAHHHVDDVLHPEWMRRPKMYDLQNMKHRGIKFGLAVYGLVAVGVFGPLAIVKFQMKKQQG